MIFPPTPPSGDIGDIAPGQANGNNLNLNGGLWQETLVSQ
jgi:hypothetical protein